MIRVSKRSISITFNRANSRIKIEAALMWPPKFSILRMRKSFHIKTIYIFGLSLGLISIVVAKEIMPKLILR